MIAKDQSIKVLMNNSVLEIPYFQRKYVWDVEDLDELMKSIQLAPKGRMPFMGCITLQDLDQKIDGLEVLSIIDGQQRMTTFSILIRALLDSYGDWQNNSNSIPHWSDMRDFIYRIDNDITTSADVLVTKLIPSKIDHQIYHKIMDSKRTSESIYTDDWKINKKKHLNKMLQAYCYFYNLIVNDEKNNLAFKKQLIDKLMTGVNFFVQIKLQKDDDAQQVFDSMNRLGVDLNSAEIVKNIIFQHLATQQQKLFNEQGIVNKNAKEEAYKVFKNTWEKIFESDEKYKFWDELRGKGRFKTTNLEFLLKDYSTIKAIPEEEENDVLSKLADNYKTYISKLNYEQTIALLKDIVSYAETYYKSRTTLENQTVYTRDDAFTCCNLLLDKTENSTFDPIILEIEHTYKNKDSSDDYNAKLFVIEKFVMAHLLSGETTKNFNRNCQTGIKKITSHNDFIKYFEDNLRDTVKQDWSQRPKKFRDFTNKQSTVILFIIELIRRMTDSQKYDSDLNYKNFTLEHIMPVEWPKNWSDVQAYNENNEPIELKKFYRDDAVNSIGNHTILPSKLNKSISNSKFLIKINGDGKHDGIKKYINNVSLARELINNTKWDERDIYKREKELYETLKNFYRFSN